ncbi:hypothetical protein Syun_016581 [Stephania yunnanensis]|uniref:Peptidase A2 domain-containing protein n=1 Tax=Stephania yunnanensis TaxID=152371 RepID=A0AAP0J5C7_9MAGN
MTDQKLELELNEARDALGDPPNSVDDLLGILDFYNEFLELNYFSASSNDLRLDPNGSVVNHGAFQQQIRGDSNLMAQLLQAFVDSGAQSTIISKSVFERCGGDQEIILCVEATEAQNSATFSTYDEKKLQSRPTWKEMFRHLHTHGHDGQSFVDQRSAKIDAELTRRLEEMSTQTPDTSIDEDVIYLEVMPKVKGRVYGLRSHGYHRNIFSKGASSSRGPAYGLHELE